MQWEFLWFLPQLILLWLWWINIFYEGGWPMFKLNIEFDILVTKNWFQYMVTGEPRVVRQIKELPNGDIEIVKQIYIGF